MKYITASLFTLFSVVAQGAILDMKSLGRDGFGNTHYVEEQFWCYGYEDQPCKYKGTNWLIQDPVGRTSQNSDVFFDCADSTWGLSTPTTEDIQTGTIIHQIYLEACK